MGKHDQNINYYFEWKIQIENWVGDEYLILKNI